MKQSYDDVDLCLCFIRYCIKQQCSGITSSLLSMIQSLIPELVETIGSSSAYSSWHDRLDLIIMCSLGALNPNAYCYTRGLVHTFQMVVLFHAHILEWLFLFAQMKQSVMEDHVSTLGHLEDSDAGPKYVTSNASSLT